VPHAFIAPECRDAFAPPMALEHPRADRTWVQHWRPAGHQRCRLPLRMLYVESQGPFHEGPSCMACVSRSSSCRLFCRAVIPPPSADSAVRAASLAGCGGATTAGASSTSCCCCGMKGLVLTAAAAAGLPAMRSLLPYSKSRIRCGDGRRSTTAARGCAGVAPGRPSPPGLIGVVIATGATPTLP
jgi:hypothetical protein